MQKVISVAYPESLAYLLNLSGKKFEKEMKTLSVVKLYEIGKISSGAAAKILGITRIDFIEHLGKYRISVFNFQNENELNDDIVNA